jgi:hypothetical protein
MGHAMAVARYLQQQASVLPQIIVDKKQSIIITKDFLEKGKSDRGGWNKKQLIALGFDGWEKKWYRRSIGMELSEEMANRFLELKNHHILQKQENIAKNEEQHKSKTTTKMADVKSNISFSEQYNHPNWQRKRLEVMERDEFKCMTCGNKQKLLHVHHNTYDGKYLWECRMQSMITLCVDCHEKIHGRKLRG